MAAMAPTQPTLPGRRVMPAVALWLVAGLAYLVVLAGLGTAAGRLLLQRDRDGSWQSAWPAAWQHGILLGPALSAEELSLVLSYATSMRPDDALIQVRPGVFAKRSNVAGIVIGGRVVYYDVFPHQSYGPLRSGKVTGPEIQVLAQELLDGPERDPWTGGRSDTLVLVYIRKDAGAGD
jgi:hypothetical protein